MSILFTAADDDKFDQDKIFEKALGIRIISELHLLINISCCHYLCLDLYIYYLYCLLHTVHICTFLCTFSLVIFHIALISLIFKFIFIYDISVGGDVAIKATTTTTTAVVIWCFCDALTLK